LFAVHTKTFMNRDDAAIAAARRVAEALHDRPQLVLGLPAGQTPVPVYSELRRLHDADIVDFSRATCFTLDEFVGLTPGDEGSFGRFMNEQLFLGLNVERHRIHCLNGAAIDPEAECRRYEAAIAAAGGIDMQLLGLGRNGHIGFNEPDDALVSRTHRVTLRAETRRDNASRFQGDPDRVPREALTMGIGTILNARAILLLATGEPKSMPVAQMIRGPVTTRVPASFLQLHSNVEVYLDRAAAARL